MTMRRLGGTVVLGVLACSATEVAVAQPAGPDEATVAEAERLFNEGISLADAGDLRGAVAAFEASWALNQVPDVLYNLGMCRKELGDFAGAANAFRDYVALAGADFSPEERAEFDALLAELAPRIGRLTVEVTEPGATVEIDGVQVGVSPLSGWHAVAPGPHEVVVRKDGFEPWRTVVQASAGEGVTARATLVGVAPPPPPPPPPPAPPPNPQPPTPALSPWFWACVGVAGAATATLAVTGSLTLVYAADFRDGGRTDAGLRDTAVALRNTTDAFLAVAVAAAVAGTVLFFVDDGGEAPPDDAASPTIGLSPGGLLISW